MLKLKDIIPDKEDRDKITFWCPDNAQWLRIIDKDTGESVLVWKK